MSVKNESYVVQLDGLRFFAVLMVMIGHWLQWSWTKPFFVNLPLSHGVVLFFVLSGFLITRILLTNRDKATNVTNGKGKLLKNFYIRRFLRIFPIYYLLLALLYYLDYKNTRDVFPWVVSYTSNLYQSFSNAYVGDFNHFWSLAVEEQFYLFWPFLIIFIKPQKTFNAIVITIILAIISKILFFVFMDNWMATTYFTLNCMSSLGIGAILAYITLYKKKTVKIISKPIWLYLGASLYLGLLILQLYVQMNWYKMVADEILFALVSALVVLRASTNSFKFGIKYILESKFVSYTGKISYGMYVYHLFIPTFYYYITYKIGLAIINKYTLTVAFFLVTFVISHLSWVLIEKPINSLKSRVPYLR
jgi:peptidoglycan/LPS O-acetylase OafA/YrhL